MVESLFLINFFILTLVASLGVTYLSFTKLWINFIAAESLFCIHSDISKTLCKQRATQRIKQVLLSSKFLSVEFSQNQDQNIVKIKVKTFFNYVIATSRRLKISLSSEDLL